MNILSSVADPGDGPRGHCSPPLFLDQNEAQRAEKSSFETAQLPSPPPQLSATGLIPTYLSFHLLLG